MNKTLINAVKEAIGSVDIETAGEEYLIIDTEILTPYNDIITLYLQDCGDNQYILTDMGETYLDTHACEKQEIEFEVKDTEQFERVFSEKYYALLNRIVKIYWEHYAK